MRFVVDSKDDVRVVSEAQREFTPELCELLSCRSCGISRVPDDLKKGLRIKREPINAHIYSHYPSWAERRGRCEQIRLRRVRNDNHKTHL